MSKVALEPKFEHRRLSRNSFKMMGQPDRSRVWIDVSGDRREEDGLIVVDTSPVTW